MNNCRLFFTVVRFLGLIFFISGCGSGIPKDINKVHIWLNDDKNASIEVNNTLKNEIEDKLRNLNRIAPRRVNKSAFLEGEYCIEVLSKDSTIQLILINETTIYNTSDGRFYDGGSLYKALKEHNLVND